MADIDHRYMTPPSLRIQHELISSAGTRVCVWDLRLAQPNVSNVPMMVMHSVEHFLGTFLREENAGVVAVAPMGCQTGLYIVALDVVDFEEIASLLAHTLERIAQATEVPLADCIHCGWAENHSLAGAQELAAWLLRQRSDWHRATSETSTLA